MIIFGTRAKYRTVGTGQFHCLHCMRTRDYERKQAKTYFALYFIPIFPLSDGGEFIECTTCRRTYALDVLNYKPSKPQPDVAQVLNAVKDKLDRGMPVEYVISDLTLEGFDRDVAGNMITMAAGEARRICPKCELTYAASVVICPDCKLALTEK